MKQKNKKPAIIFISVVVFLVLVIALYYTIAGFMIKDGIKYIIGGKIYLYPPDYESNIFENEKYLELDRQIKYSDGFGTWVISDNNGICTNDNVEKFLVGYISCLQNADIANLKAYYSDNCFKELKLPSRITMQKIYEPIFTEVKKELIRENDQEFYRYDIKVEYKIMRNDGTFRSDIASDSIKPQNFIIEERNETVKIIQVVNYVIPQ